MKATGCSLNLEERPLECFSLLIHPLEMGRVLRQDCERVAMLQRQIQV